MNKYVECGSGRIWPFYSYRAPVSSYSGVATSFFSRITSDVVVAEIVIPRLHQRYSRVLPLLPLNYN